MAEAQREVFSEALDTSLATKSDIARLEQATKDEMTRLDRRLDGLDAQLLVIKWMLGIIIGGVVALLLKFLFPL